MSEKRSYATRAARKFADLQTKLAEKLREENTVSFGNVRMSPEAFRSRIRSDEGFRMAMSSRMGPHALARFMTASMTGGSDAGTQTQHRSV